MRRKYRDGQIVSGFKVLEYLGYEEGSKNPRYRLACRHCGEIRDVFTNGIKATRCACQDPFRDAPDWYRKLYARYGAAWKTPKAFRDEVPIDRPESKRFLDAVTGNTPGPNNWKWSEVSASRRTRIGYYEYKGESKTVREWADALGCSRQHIAKMLKLHGTIDVVISKLKRTERQKRADSVRKSKEVGAARRQKRIGEVHGKWKIVGVEGTQYVFECRKCKSRRMSEKTKTDKFRCWVCKPKQDV